MNMAVESNSENSSAIASSDAAAVNPLGDALSALERRDYATAQRLFETLGRKTAAEAIKDALAALDRKDYATAQGLFEALSLEGGAAARTGSAPTTPAPTSPAPTTPAPATPAFAKLAASASDSEDKAQHKHVISPLKVIPLLDAASRPPVPQTKKARARGLKSLLLGTGPVLVLIIGASALYGSPSTWTFATIKSQAIAGLASAGDVLKAPLEATARLTGREEERSAMRDLSAALAQVSIRLDQIEQEHGARLDKLGERIDRDSASRSADVAARLEEKRAAVPAASEFADVVARLDKLEKKAAAPAAPASEFADITTRLNRLEKAAAVSAASSAKSIPPATPKQSTLVARAERSASNEIARPENPKPLLRDYSVEDVQDGMAVVDGRYGPQQVAPGDFIRGAGRVLRIERRGGDWVVLTSTGVISSGPARY